MHKTGKIYKAIENIDKQNKTTHARTRFALLNGVREQTGVHKIQDK